MRILDIPFDEVPGAVTAYDLSSSRRNALTVAGQFKKGFSGNAVYFNGPGRAMADLNTNFLLGDFIVSLYAKTLPNPVTISYVRLRIFFADGPGDELRYVQAQFAGTLAEWTHIDIERQGDTFFIHQDTLPPILLYALSGWGDPTWMTMYSDGVDGTGYCAVENLLVHTPPYGIDQIINNMDIIYEINGVRFDDLGITVEASNGINDHLQLKEPEVYDLIDYHGLSVDLSNPKFKEREIVLECWMECVSPQAFITQTESLVNELRKPYTQRLSISQVIEKPLLYEVYCKAGIKIQKEWRDEDMVVNFTLTLIEPLPVKRVLKHIRTGPSDATATITLTSPHLLTVTWGDGTVSDDVYGTQTLTHTYPANGEYYIILSGDIELITGFTSNAVSIWNRF